MKKVNSKHQLPPGIILANNNSWVFLWKLARELFMLRIMLNEKKKTIYHFVAVFSAPLEIGEEEK